MGACVVLLLAGCASGIPAWMDQPPVEAGYRYSSGRSTSYSRSGARQAALANAVRELAFQQGTSTSISGMEIVAYHQVDDGHPDEAPFDYCVLIRIREADLFR